MKPYPLLIPALLLVFVTSTCAQMKRKTEAVDTYSPQPLWQYDTGG